jgi:hypothetical protein
MAGINEKVYRNLVTELLAQKRIFIHKITREKAKSAIGYGPPAGAERSDCWNVVLTQRVKTVADRLGKHPATVWRWIQRGCDIDSEQSINQFLEGNHRKGKGPRQHHPKTIRKPKWVSRVEPSLL